MIYVTPKELDIIINILKKYNLKQVYAFGSRTTGKHNNLSDLDILIKDDIKGDQLYLLQEDFKESNLPYKVDAILWSRCDAIFQKTIGSQLTPLITS